MMRDGSAHYSTSNEIRHPAQVTESIGYAISRAKMRIYEEFFASLADFDTTPIRYTLMLLIRENPGIRAADLARLLGVARSRLVKLVDGLETRELILRKTQPGDRRNRILVLTSQGERKLNQLEQVVEYHEAQMTKGFSAEERERLIDLLWRVARPR